MSSRRTSYQTVAVCAALSASAASLAAAVGRTARGLGLEQSPAEATGVVPGSPLMDAMDAVAERSAEPVRARGTLLTRMMLGPHCYAGGLSQEEYERLLEHTLLWPAVMVPPGGFGAGSGAIAPRYYSDTQVWTGNLSTGPLGLAQRAHLTYSFPDDGTPWGLSATGFTGPNTLGASLSAGFGSLDRGREYIRAALAAWRRVAGLTYTEVADDNQQQTISSTRDPSRGDIRIGGFEFAATLNGFLAYNAFPTNQGASNLGGGDMTINTSYFVPAYLLLQTADYLYLRNTVSHEHGHGLGFIHSVPCDQTKLMEPSISLGPVTLSRDEIRGAGRNYGDRFSGNYSRPEAADLGNLTTPSLRSVILLDLSSNVTTLNNSEEDYFRFTIDSAQSVTLTVTPTGSIETQGRQTGTGCSGSTSSINSLACGNLNLQLLSTTGTVLATAPAQPAGTAETLSMPSLAAGTYVVFIDNSTSVTAADPNQYVQTYDLTIRVGTSKARPDPIAGLNKRVRAATTAFFNGPVNSRATEPGATLPATGYDWDLDGDGVFETLGVPQPTIVYPSNGVYPVTLRLTDSNGMAATDQISVTVFGATTSVNSVSPGSALPGQTMPVTIFGANLKGVTSASQVTVTGGGVTVTGTPVVNALGTQITGLSFVISTGAAQSARTVTITNSDGQGASGSGVGVFTVGQPGQPPSNDECSAPISWGSLLGNRPFNNANATTGAQQSFPGTGCPASGPISNDVWYSWVAPTRGNLTVNTDSAAAGFQSRVAMYRSAPCAAGGSPTTLLRCDDFGTAFTASVATGVSYLFQVGSVTQGQTGAANVILSLAPSAGACCAAGSCTPTDEGACLGIGGEWTFAAVCTPTFCPEATGACCISGSCFINSPAECAGLGAGASWQGAGTACGTPGNPTTCCRANFNGVGGVTVQDVFDYLAAWFGLSPAADMNGDSAVTLQDLFDYLAAYFNGCA